MILSLGFDASTKGAAWALLEVDYNSRKYIAHGDLDDEEQVRGRVRMHANTKAGNVEPWRSMHKYPAIVLGVEVVTGFGHKGADEYGQRAMSRDLLATQAVANFIRGFATGLDLHVIAMSSGEARRHLFGGRAAGAKDADVARALRIVVPSWPAAPKTNDHHRDAGTIAFAAAQRFGVTSGWG